MTSLERLYNVLRAPCVSEKTARVQAQSNQYVFEVSTEATKSDVKLAVEAMFDVAVISVNICNLKGKAKSFRSRLGRRGNRRKAYVRLRDGQTISIASKA